MPRVNLTTAAVERIKPPRSGQVEHYDLRLPSFGLRVSYRGGKAWFMMTRVDGRLVRLTLGQYPAISLAEARDKARAAGRMVAEGKDPRTRNAEERSRREEERRNTFGACAAEFLVKHAETRLRPSTQREYRRILTGPDTRAWQEKPLSSICKRDVHDVLDRMNERGSPGAAKRALVYLRKFFNWCAERDLILVAPTDRIVPPHPEVRRDRVLSIEEVSYLLAALACDGSLFGRLFLILFLTGQRRAEVAGIRWSEIKDLGGNQARWEIPGTRTKNKQSHIVPLSTSVCRILVSVHRIGDLVFTTTGQRPVSGFGRAKERLSHQIDELRSADGLAAMPPWTLHDLRRTMVTMMNERLSIPPHIVEAVVNHMSGSAKAGVAGVYNRALYLEERRTALSRWADFLSQLPGQAS